MNIHIISLFGAIKRMHEYDSQLLIYYIVSHIFITTQLSKPTLPGC